MVVEGMKSSRQMGQIGWEKGTVRWGRVVDWGEVVGGCFSSSEGEVGRVSSLKV